MPEAFPDLPPALPGAQRDIAGAAGRMRLYEAGSTFAGDATQPPLLLVHSINAAASAYEMEPLYRYYRARRPVYAVDLPGYGHADRSERDYTPRLMTDAVLAAVDAFARQHGGVPIDVIGLSLSSEFVARAATERPTAFRTVTMVAATGLDGRRYDGPPGSTRGKAWALSVFGRAPWSALLFRTLTRRGVVRFFLRKTFGRRDVDEGLVDYAFRTAHQKGAQNAPFHFLSAFLFSADISRVYETVPQPVLLVHGTRGDFVKYPDAGRMARVAGWTVAVMETGALPYFEDLDGFVRIYESFLAERAPTVARDDSHRGE